MRPKWRGLFPALTTKMARDGQVDLDWTQRSLQRLLDKGVSGVVVLPMLGENASLQLAERERVVRAASELVGERVPLLCGLAEISLESATERARTYEGWGARGLMVFPSLGYKTDARETVAWYRDIARSTSLPVMIYNNPIAYGVDVNPEILGQLDEIPEIVCIKEESGDIRRITDLSIAFGDRFGIFCGVDDLIVESVALGATGWVSGMANAWPSECLELLALCTAQRSTEARELYHILTPSFHLDTHVKLVQYIKLTEHLVYGAPEWTRAPRLPLVGAERESVQQTVLASINALKRRAAAKS